MDYTDQESPFRPMKVLVGLLHPGTGRVLIHSKTAPYLELKIENMVKLAQTCYKFRTSANYSKGVSSFVTKLHGQKVVINDLNCWRVEYTGAKSQGRIDKEQFSDDGAGRYWNLI